MKKLSAKAVLSLCMAVFGTVPLFIRLIPLSSAEIALWRAVLAALCIVVYLAAGRKRLRLADYRGKAWLFLLSGAAMGANWVLLFESYRHTTVSVATLVYYTAPVMVTAASALLLREKISRFQAVCMGLVLLGLALIVNPAGGGGAGTGLGILMALGSAVLYATVIMLNRMTEGVPGVQRTLLQFFSAIAVLLPYVLLGGGLFIGGIDARGLAALVTLGALHTGLAYCLYFGSIQSLKGREIAILSYIDPLVAVLLSALLLREPFTPLQGLGGAMILFFTFLSERGGLRQPEAQAQLYKK